MVGIQVGNEQEERKGEEKRMIRENIGNSLSRAMRETTSAAATLTTRRSKCSCSSAERRERERERDRGFREERERIERERDLSAIIFGARGKPSTFVYRAE